ncbi:MAG: dTMP kinase [Thermodesulfovibrionales bacterium]|jgi:dTMP kinase
MKGKFISFEGIEGTGKSTQAKLLQQSLLGLGYEVILTEEPGGTLISLRIREILLSVDHTNMKPLTELLLYNAARAQHIEEVILPALNRGAVVITDRFTDSTFAYQGYGRGIDPDLLESIDKIATNGLRPDMTMLLDLDVETGLKRNRRINKTDRLELEDVEFHQRVRKGYHELAAKEPERIKVLDASAGIEELKIVIAKIISDFIGRQ